MDQQYTHRLEKIEAVLNRWLPENPTYTWAAEVFPGLPVDKLDIQMLYVLTTPGKELLSRGGKRWRPLLMTLVCEALGGGNAALPLTPLVEFCHNASLIHDDIEDNSDERRGRPAAHIVHGVDVAINSGSFLYFLPLACLDSWAEGLPGIAADVYTLWADYLRKLHLGQAMDIHWHRNFELIPSLNDYFTMCKLKTGSLARFAAELGAAVVAINSTKPLPVLATYLGEAAEKLGVGFQILDDIKNVTTGIPGKKRGDDIVEGKKSLPVLLFLHHCPEKSKMVFRCFKAARAGGIDAPEVNELIHAMLNAGVFAEAETRGKTFIAEARSTFAAADLSDEGRKLLTGLVDLIT